MKIEPGTRRLESESNQTDEASEGSTGQGSNLSSATSGDRRSGRSSDGVATSRNGNGSAGGVDSGPVGSRVCSRVHRVAVGRIAGSAAAGGGDVAAAATAANHKLTS